MRKEAGYAVEQRIKLGIFPASVIAGADGHIMAETLADTLSTEEHLPAPDLTREIDIAGETITLEISK